MDRYSTLAVLVSAILCAATFTPSRVVLDTPPQQGVASSPLLASLLPLPPSALKAIHLLSFAVAFGTAVWVTFVAGVVLFRVLPRHQFGTVQSHLFPAFFRLQVLACSLSLAAFAASPPSPSSPSSSFQLLLLAVALSGWLSNLLLFEPVTTKIMRERHKIEREAGLGQEVGLSKNREVAKTNPALAAVNRRFGLWHGLSSLANLAALCSLGAHGWHIAVQGA